MYKYTGKAYYPPTDKPNAIHQKYPLDLRAVESSILKTKIWEGHKPVVVGDIRSYTITSSGELLISGMLNDKGKFNYENGMRSFSIGYNVWHVGGASNVLKHELIEISQCKEPVLAECAMKLELSKQKNNMDIEIIKIILSISEFQMSETNTQSTEQKTEQKIEQKTEQKVDQKTEDVQMGNYETAFDSAFDSMTPEELITWAKSEKKKTFSQKLKKIDEEYKNLSSVFNTYQETIDQNEFTSLAMTKENIANPIFNVIKKIHSENTELKKYKEQEENKKMEDVKKMEDSKKKETQKRKAVNGLEQEMLTRDVQKKFEQNFTKQSIPISVQNSNDVDEITMRMFEKYSGKITDVSANIATKKVFHYRSE